MEGPKRAKKEMLDAVVELADKVMSKGRKSMKEMYPLLFDEKNIENIFIFTDENKVVSMVGLLPKIAVIFGHQITVGMIGSVCTDPEYRGKGLASALMDFAQKEAIKMGLDMLYISGDRKLYRRMGAVNSGRFYMGEIRNKDEVTEVREASIKDLDTLIHLRSKEKIRFWRSYEDFEKIFKSEYAVDLPARYFFNEQAYVTVVKRENIPRIVEFAGEEDEILKIASTILLKENSDLLYIHFPHGYFENRKFKRKKRKFFGTNKIISKSSILKKLKPYFEERLKASLLKKLMEEIKGMSESDLTYFLFNSIEKEIKYPEYLKDVLPIPLPDYGADYI